MDAYERMEATLREIKRKHKAVLDDREDEARRLFNNNDDLEDEVARLKGQINGLNPLKGLGLLTTRRTQEKRQ